MISGQAVEVRLLDRGSSASEDSLAGADSVTVDDPTPFDVDALVWINDEVYSITDVAVLETVDDDVLTTRGVLTVNPPLAADLAASEPVSLWSGAQVLDDLIVDVDLGDGDPVAVILDSGQRKDWRALEGSLDPPIAVLLSDDLASVLDAPGYALPLDLSTADISTAPEGLGGGGPVEPTTPPASSPTPATEEGPASVIVRVARVDDAQTYELHVAAGTTTTDGEGNAVPVAPAAAPSLATLHTADAPELLTVSQYGGPDRAEIPVDTTAWFAVVATNGPTLKASPSPWIAGRRGQIPAEYMLLLAGAVLAQRVIGEVLEGVTVRGSTFETSSAPDRGIKLDTAMRVFNLLGDLFLVADPLAEDFQVTGVGKFRSITQTEGGSLGGETEIPTNSKLTARSATSAPKGAPAVATGYSTRQFFDDGFWSDRRGWASDGDYWYTTRPVPDNTNALYLEQWNLNGTYVGRTGLNLLGPLRRLCGVAVSAGRVVVMVERKRVSSDANSSDRIVSFATAAAGTRQSVRYQHEFASAQADSFNVLGSTDNQLVRRYLVNSEWVNNYRINGNGDVVSSGTDFANYNVGGFDNTYYTTTVFTPGDLAGLLVLGGPFGGGANAQALTTTTAGPVVARRSAKDAAVNSNGWPSAPSAKIGLAYHAGAFHSMSATGVMTTYTDHPGGDVFVSSTFARGGSLTTAPTAETTQSPRTMYTIPKRGGITVTASAVPPNAGSTGPTHVRIYAATGSTDPGRTAMRIQAAPAAGTRTALLTSIATTGAVPPATSSFSGGTPGGWEAESGGMNFDGNSGGDVGTGSFRDSVRAAVAGASLGTSTLRSQILAAVRDDSRTSTSAAVTAVSPFTTDATVEMKPNGNVLLSGSFSRASGSSAAFVQCGTIPTGYRPSANQLFPASIIFNDTTLNYQVQILTTGVVNIRQSAAITTAMGVSGYAWSAA